MTRARTKSIETTSRTPAGSKGTTPSRELSKVSVLRGPQGDVTAILAPDLEPTSFDDLPLGGEWTTRRRTISESEIALFAAVAGDFSPLAVDATLGGGRFAAPALVIAVAIGLGSMDMPVPAVAEWEWTNWKFPRPVRAGDTIYARWTLTQKRPAVGGSATAVAVWRVDVHTADGALCAAGEVGASVQRHPAAVPARGSEPIAAASPASRRRRRRRATPGAPAAKAAAAETPAQRDLPETAPARPEPVPPLPAKRGGETRRRRRRRSSGSQANRNGEPASPAAAGSNSSPAPLSASPRGDVPTLGTGPGEAGSRRTPLATAKPANPISRAIRRLRRN